MKLLSTFLRFFFRHLYTTFAWAYDLVAMTTSMGQWGTWQTAALDVLPHQGRVLEVGHGPGHLLKHRALEGCIDFGVDVSTQMGRIAYKRMRVAGFQPHLVRAQAQALPFASASFQAIYATFPSEFILAPETLASFQRVLRSDGSLVVVPMARITGRSLPDRWAAWLYSITGQSRDIGTGWKKLLQDSGFHGTLERVQQPRAEVYRLIATKLPTQDGFAGPDGTH
ncbi:MAG TPA: class I SAM-dependent methyltransferase [Anaerolineae bacterium]|nr:class I SAM-dependent methyltransferase [Anaerolineae bacterium]